MCINGCCTLTPFWNCLRKTHLVFYCRTFASYGQNVVNKAAVQYIYILANTIYYCYYILLGIILYTTLFICVPFMAQPQPPPFKLVASLSRFLLWCLRAPASFQPSLDRSKTEFLRLLNAYGCKQNCIGNCRFSHHLWGEGGWVIYFVFI